MPLLLLPLLRRGRSVRLRMPHPSLSTPTLLVFLLAMVSMLLHQHRLLPALKMLPQSLLPSPLPMASRLVSPMASPLVSLMASQLVLLLPLLPPLLLLLLPVRQSSPPSRPTPAVPSSTQCNNCSLLYQELPSLTLVKSIHSAR